MEQNIEIILNILSKDRPSVQDKKLIEKIFSKDPAAKDFFNKFKHIEDIVKASSHISLDDFSEYILFKNNNSTALLSDSKIRLIENHLKKCDKCSKVFSELSLEYEDIGSFISKNLPQPDPAKDRTNVLKIHTGIFNVFKYPVASAAIIIVLYFSLLIISDLTTPQYYKYSSIDENSLNYITRGRATNNFQTGLNALDKGNPDLAIKYFKKDISDNKNDGTIFYTNYILGLTYLENAEKDFLGLFPSYDHRKVNAAIENLNKCILKNNSGNFPNITSNAYFFISKAYLMLDNPNMAKINLQIVIKLKGSRSAEAKRILDNIQ